jgi:hypothetical protein
VIREAFDFPLWPRNYAVVRIVISAVVVSTHTALADGWWMDKDIAPAVG